MKVDVENIRNRQKSMDEKLQGDIYFARNLLTDALKAYEKAIELDPNNEYAISNIGVIHLKREDYDKCFEYTEKALDIIELFQYDTKEFMPDNVLEVKLLQRRAKCYEIKNEFEKAKEDLDKAMILDRNNQNGPGNNAVK